MHYSAFGLKEGTRLQPRSSISAVLPLTWLLAAALIAFTVENLWLDPWLQARSHHRLPSFVPPPETNAGLAVFFVLGFLTLLLVVLQIFALLDKTAPRWKKATAVAASVLAVGLFGSWCVKAATGQSPLALLVKSPPHSVTLQWKASTSPVDGYNVYRAFAPGAPFLKLNTARVKALTFIDHDVESGSTYYYFVTAVDSSGHESSESSQVSATIP